MPRSAPQMPARLTEAAFELFAEHGFEAVTVDDIATHAGVTKGSFYSHFQSKREIILAACAFYYGEYQRKVQRAIARLSDPHQRLRRVLEISVRSCVLDRGNRVFTTEVFALLLQDDEVRAGWSQFYDSVRKMYLGLLIAADGCQVPAAEARRAVDLMLAAMEGVKMRAAFEPQIGSRAQQATIVDDLLRVLGFPAGSRAARSASSATPSSARSRTRSTS